MVEVLHLHLVLGPMYIILNKELVNHCLPYRQLSTLSEHLNFAHYYESACKANSWIGAFLPDLVSLDTCKYKDFSLFYICYCLKLSISSGMDRRFLLFLYKNPHGLYSVLNNKLTPKNRNSSFPWQDDS